MDLIWEGLRKAMELLLTLDAEVLRITLLSLKVSGIATLLSVILGLGLALGVALNEFPGKRLLIALVNKGVLREDAYKWVQRNAMRSFSEERDFKALLLADPDVTAVLPSGVIDETFDLNSQLRNVDTIFDRVFARSSAESR